MWPPKSSSYAYINEIQEDLIIQFIAVCNFRVNIPFVALTWTAGADRSTTIWDLSYSQIEQSPPQCSIVVSLTAAE